jgi:hypothetical protein
MGTKTRLMPLLLLLALVVCAGCAAPAGTRMYAPGSFGIRRPPEISYVDAIAAVNGIRLHGIRFAHARTAVRLHYTPILRPRHIDDRRPPTAPRWSFVGRVSTKQEPLGRLDGSVGAPKERAQGMPARTLQEQTSDE